MRWCVATAGELDETQVAGAEEGPNSRPRDGERRVTRMCVERLGTGSCGNGHLIMRWVKCGWPLRRAALWWKYKKAERGGGRKEEGIYQPWRNICKGTWLGLLSMLWCLASTPLRCFAERVFRGLVRTLFRCLVYGRIFGAFPVYSSGALPRHYFGA